MIDMQRLAAVVLVLAAGPAAAQTTVEGTIPERSTPAGIADTMESNWNVTEFDCLRRSSKGGGNVFITNLPQGQSLISLPRTVTAPPMADAADLFAALGGRPPVDSVSKFDTSTDTLRTWDEMACTNPEPGCPGTCFCIDTASGEGFHVSLTNGTTFNVQGKDGALNIELTAPGNGTPPSASGTHQISLPYATPLVTASELFESINVQAGSAATVTVQRLQTDGNLVAYNGFDPLTDFALESGLGYRVQVAADVVYTPPFVDSGEGPTLYVTANSGGCVSRQLALTFDVPGGETTEPIAFALQLDCSAQNTLTAAMGINGGPLMDITSGFVDLGPFSTVGMESSITGEVIPTLGEWGLILFTVVLLTSGVLLILGRLG